MTIEVKQRIESIKIELTGGDAERFMGWLVECETASEASSAAKFDEIEHYARNMKSSIIYASIHGRSE